MSDSSKSTSSFPSAGYEMFEKMWNMMTNSPFAAFTGGMPQMMTPSISRLAEMAAPLTNPDELDKRITDMRAIEQWLKLNTGMLQSTIQALEVQRATLATLKSFGALAQSSLDSATRSMQGAMHDPASLGTSGTASTSGTSGDAPAASPFDALKGWPMAGGWPGATGDAAGADKAGSAASSVMDPSAWWNVLQNQFNQLASLAMPASAPTDGKSGAAAQGAARQAPSAPSRRSVGGSSSASVPAKKTASRAGARKSGR